MLSVNALKLYYIINYIKLYVGYSIWKKNGRRLGDMLFLQGQRRKALCKF